MHEERLAKSLPDLYAADFTEVRTIAGRMAKAAAWSDLTGKDRPEKPWLNGWPRMIFLGDMGDLFSRQIPFEFLRDGEYSDWNCGMCGSTNVDTEVQVGPGDVGTYECRDCKYFGGGEDPNWKSLIHWVICGGESRQADFIPRPFNIAWPRKLRDECKAAEVLFFMKQLGDRAYEEREHPQRPGEKIKLPVGAGPKGEDFARFPRDLQIREVPLPREVRPLNPKALGKLF
jgi:hypothetical protein